MYVCMYAGMMALFFVARLWRWPPLLYSSGGWAGQRWFSDVRVTQESWLWWVTGRFLGFSLNGFFSRVLSWSVLLAGLKRVVYCGYAFGCTGYHL